MSIKVNGKQVIWIENETVKQLLKRMKYTFPLVVVKINDKLVPRSSYTETIIPDKAKIAVIHMISGG
ncbi:MAG: sulfur carrier protein ThiS [Thermoplasmatales archaeon]|jgi:thiazole synthase/sulfur carrier protein|nr:MAG: sulfur carrier protein ThiS [Thermoplasmatales archaeon]